MRLSEVKQLRDNPTIFDRERGTIAIRSGKDRATQTARNICLSDKGKQAVEAYLKNPIVPGSPTAWQMNLIRWAERGRLAPLPGHEATGNPYGITVRTTRKTWESWLLAAFPDRLVHITLSQGHSETVSLRHYLNVSFTADERQDIKREVRGWGCH